MSDEEISPKKQKLSRTNNDQHRLKDRNSTDQASSTPIYKLNAFCCDEIFDYLSLSDLHSLGQTCKTMQRVAGEYFKRNFIAADTVCQEDGIYMRYSDGDATDQRCKIDGFNKFITKMTYHSVSIEPLKYLEKHSDEFESITQISLPSIGKHHVKYIERVLNKIESVHIVRGWIEVDLYESLLKSCKKLKFIHLRLVRELGAPGHRSWLQQKYPKLQHLELIPVDSIDLLHTFFEHNPNVRSFSMSLLCIYVFRDDFMRSNVKLDTFEVEYFSVDRHFALESVYDVVNKLHEKGFYKKLHFYMSNINQESSDQLISLKGLELLCVRNFTHTFSLTGLMNLKELAILNGANPVDMDILANHLIKIERLYVKNATLDDILPFIRRSTNLNKIKVNKIKAFARSETSFENGILNLVRLNKEREKLIGARKLLIFVPDNIFLRTKWATKDGDTNLSLVEMRRGDSYDWKYDE